MISEDVLKFYARPLNGYLLDSPLPYALVLEDYVLPQLDDLVKPAGN